jgi:hypothetical protein
MPYTLIELVEKLAEMSELVGNLKVSLQICEKGSFVEKNLKGALNLAEDNVKALKKDLISMGRR